MAVKELDYAVALQPNIILDRMVRAYSRVTAQTAIAAHRTIAEFHNGYKDGLSLPKDLTESWKIPIDEAASVQMRESLGAIPFRTIKVGSEGDKEAETEKGGQAAPSVKGDYGHESHFIVHGVSDVVEGTTLASQKRPGASSVIAITTEGGIMPTPRGESNDYNYMVKLIAPRQARDVMSLNNPHEDNIVALCAKLGINPNELIQVTLNPKTRPVNERYVDAAKKAGMPESNIKLIDIGDFMPGVRAVMDPEVYKNTPMIVVGRGGFEEGIMAAAAARALGGFMEARQYRQDPKLLGKEPVWTLDDLVPGPRDLTLVAATFITRDDSWFHVPGIRPLPDGGYRTETMVVTHRGVQFFPDAHKNRII